MEIIKLNLIPSGVNPTCHAKQYDKGRIIRFELFNGLTPYTLQSGDTVTLNLRKPDNTIIKSSVTATQGNKYVDLVTTEQMCAVAGYNLGTFKIVNGETDIGTLNFIMAVERDVLADGVPSQSVIEDLDALVAEAVEEDLGDNYYTKTETNEKIENELSPINTQLDYIGQDIRLLYDGNEEFTGGVIDATTGIMNTAYASYFKTTDYIKVEGYKNLIIFADILTDATSNAGCAFYDNNKNFVSGILFDVATVASTETRLINVPDNAIYFRTCCRVSEVSDFFVEVNTLKVIEKVINEVDLDNIVPDLNYIGQDIRLLYDGNEEFTGGVIDATTGALNTAYASYYKATDYIDITDLKALYIFAAVLSSSSNAGCAFYDTNKTYISGKKFNVATVASTETRLINVPDNAIYFRTCCRVSEVSDFFVAVNTFRVLEKEIEKLQVQSSDYGLQLFEKIGVIGDSISVGWAKDKNGNNSRRNVGISWVQQLARRLGCTAYNLGASGVDPIEWFDPTFEFAEYCYTQYQSVGFCDLYIVGLGLNDGTLGTISDINESDYTQNAPTFYGQYARIIQMINADHPSAIVVCLTEPTTRAAGYDQAVRNICALNFINAQLLDLENDYFDIFNTPDILAELQPDGLHYTPYGYSLLAESMAYALNDYISKNSSVFKYVGVANV